MDDIRAVLWVAIVVLVAWAAIPALGALLLGFWLRRTLATTSEPSTVPTVTAQRL